MMNLNARAPFYLIQCALPYLIERRGAIVNVSSVTGIRAFPGILAYCASKAAVDQLTHCVALEVASNGVRVNAVNPAWSSPTCTAPAAWPRMRIASSWSTARRPIRWAGLAGPRR